MNWSTKVPNHPKVSIIMPSLNVVKYIKECMDSVVNQTLKDIEIICVDAGSTDGTLEILKEYTKKDKRIKLIISDKKSYGYQMNLGIDAASGEYLGIVETDDYIKLNMYEKLYKVAKEQGCEVLKCDLEEFWGDGFKKKTYAPLAYDKDIYHVLWDKNQLKNTQKGIDLILSLITNTWNMNQPGLYKMDFIKNNNIRFNETPGAAYQDTGFWFITQFLANTIFYLNKAYYCYRKDNENSSCNSKNKVFDLCAEYQAIYSFLAKNKELESFYKRAVVYKQFFHYIWNYNRIDDGYKADFITRFCKEFQKFNEDGLANKKLFGDKWIIYQKVISSPLECAIALSRLRIDFFEKRVKSTRASMSYKIGRVITWLPRLINKKITNK